MAVGKGVFPLYEVENGKYKITHKVEKLKPITDYIKGQGRFKHLSDDIISQIQEKVNVDWENLNSVCGIK